MSTSVFCIVPNQTIANDIVARLKSADFADNDISVLFCDKSGSCQTDKETDSHTTKSKEVARKGAGAGGVVGGTLGLLAGIGLLAIPGVGPFIAAGPIMATLGGIAAGAAVGGVSGALIGLGIPENDATRYEEKIKAGNILIAAHSDNLDDVKNATRIFTDAKATDISTGLEAKLPASKNANPRTSALV
jgi:hypothetical protein